MILLALLQLDSNKIKIQNPMGRKSKGIRLIYLKFYSKTDSVSLSLMRVIFFCAFNVMMKKCRKTSSHVLKKRKIKVIRQIFCFNFESNLKNTKNLESF